MTTTKAIRGRTGAVLRDRRLDAALHREGYVVTRVIPPSVAARLRTRFGDVHGWARQELLDGQAPDFEIATWSEDPEYRGEIAGMVDGATTLALGELFDRHRPIGHSLMIKWPSEGTERWRGVPDSFHNDSMFIDERTGTRSWMVWLALQDIDRTNGGLLVVPYSHRLDRTVRGWGVDAPWIAYEDVYEPRAVRLSLRAGEAVLFDPALLHRSDPNLADEARVAASILLVERGVPLCLFRRVDESTAEKVPLTDDFFTTGRYGEVHTYPAVEQVPLDWPDLSPDEVGARLDRFARLDRLTPSWPLGRAR